MGNLRLRRALAIEKTRYLIARDPVLGAIVERTGPPRWRSRQGGFPGLARIIIEQQLSVASANAILGRASAGLDGLDPRAVRAASEDTLRGFGLSRPKIRYLKALADDILEGRFAFLELEGLADQEAAAKLETLLGVGRWTAAVFLLFCEGRLDLWPRGDVALLAAHGMAGGSYGRGDIKAFDAFAEKTYAPYRGLAAHILWGQIALARGREPV